MPRINAILTGDLVGSRGQDAAAVDESLAALRDGARALGEKHGFDPRFTRHRGDGWHMALPDPHQALDACLSLAAALRAADTALETRIAVGIGAVTHWGSKDLSDASGQAFEVSGDLLDQMTRHGQSEQMMIAGQGITRWPQATLALADHVARGWTKGQAEAVAMVLLDTDRDTNEKRAQALGISRQAFDARLHGSGLGAMERALDAFRSHCFDPAQGTGTSA